MPDYTATQPHHTARRTKSRYTAWPTTSAPSRSGRPQKGPHPGGSTSTSCAGLPPAPHSVGYTRPSAAWVCDPPPPPATTPSTASLIMRCPIALVGARRACRAPCRWSWSRRDHRRGDMKCARACPCLRALSRAKAEAPAIRCEKSSFASPSRLPHWIPLWRKP